MVNRKRRLEEILSYNLPESWKKILNCALKKSNWIIEECINQAEELNKEYNKNHCIKSKSLKQLLYLPDIVLILFYLKQYNMKNYSYSRPLQIIYDKRDSKWMLERDYCFFNIRALGKDIAETGNIIDAIKLLPALRVNGIHIAPFFECDNGIIYCQNSFYKINHEIVNIKYVEEGISAKEQMNFFIDCCHLLGKATGFDVTPHTSWKSRLRLDRPDLFRWIRLNEKKSALYGNMNIDQQYSDQYQKECQKKVQNIVEEYKYKYHLTKIDQCDGLCSRKEIVEEINGAVYKAGYYCVPPHTWNGLSVPGFKKYAYNIDMPIWEYKDKNGMDQGRHAIFLHANFYIHKGMKANKMPAQGSEEIKRQPIKKNEDTFSFFIAYIAENIQTYLFDYIRMDYVDHIFHNTTYISAKEIPLNEMFTPCELKEISDTLRKKWPGLGFQADHLGYDVFQYKRAGFNLITGGEVGLEWNRKNLKEIFEHLSRQSEFGNEFCRATWAVDTHDMAHPLFLGKELIHREGTIGILVRFFISRFANVGKYRRPKYEVIGNQDSSFGIHRTNNRPESLVWEDDTVMYGAYHTMEDVYDRGKEEFNRCKMTSYKMGKWSICFSLYNEFCQKAWIGVLPISVNHGEKYRDNTNVNEASDYFPFCTKIGKEVQIKCLFCMSMKDIDWNYTSNYKDMIHLTNNIGDNHINVEVKQCCLALFEL